MPCVRALLVALAVVALSVSADATFKAGRKAFRHGVRVSTDGDDEVAPSKRFSADDPGSAVDGDGNGGETTLNAGDVPTSASGGRVSAAIKTLRPNNDQEKAANKVAASAAASAAEASAAEVKAAEEAWMATYNAAAPTKPSDCWTKEEGQTFPKAAESAADEDRWDGVAKFEGAGDYATSDYTRQKCCVSTEAGVSDYDHFVTHCEYKLPSPADWKTADPPTPGSFLWYVPCCVSQDTSDKQWAKEEAEAQALRDKQAEARKLEAEQREALEEAAKAQELAELHAHYQTILEVVCAKIAKPATVAELTVEMKCWKDPKDGKGVVRYNAGPDCDKLVEDLAKEIESMPNAQDFKVRFLPDALKEKTFELCGGGLQIKTLLTALSRAVGNKKEAKTLDALSSTQRAEHV